MSANNSSAPVPVQVGSSENSVSHKVISSIAITILIILTLFGNGLVISAFYVFKRIRKSVTNWFILSLAISDMMVAFITEPIWLAGEILSWQYPPEIDVPTFLMLWTLIDIICAISSISNLMFISVDRFFAIKHPLIHHTKMTPGKCKWIILLSWVHAGGTSCLYLVDPIWKYVVIFLFGFIIPLIVILFCYGGILHVVISRSRLTHRHGKRLSTEYKTAKSLGVVTGAFVACWLPFFIASLAFWYCESCRRDIDTIPAITSAVKWLHYLNSCLNPIIYAFLNPTFKIAFRNLIRRMCGKETLNSLETETSFASFRRRDTYASVKSNENGKEKSGNVPNGNASFYKSPLLKQEGTKMNGAVKHNSISDDGSVERGIETPEDKYFGGDPFCSTPPPPSYEEWYQLKNCESNNVSQTSSSYVPVAINSDWKEAPKQTCPIQCDRTVSFSNDVKICGENSPEKTASDMPALEGHISTYHDEKSNQTFLLVDGVQIPDGEIRTTDV